MSEITVPQRFTRKMAGIKPLSSLSELQIVVMAGGPTLHIEAVVSKTHGAQLDLDDVVLEGSQRLGKDLLDSLLTLPLLIQVAQKWQSAVFQTQDAHLTLLVSLYEMVRLFDCYE